MPIDNSNDIRLLASFRQSSNHQEIINQCNILLQSRPNSSTYLIYRGEAYTKLGKTEAAMNDFNLALELEPNNSERFLALYYRGYFFYQNKEYAKAVRDLTEVFNNNPDTGNVAGLLGTAYYHLNELEQAIDYLTSVLEKNNKDLVALDCRASAYRDLGQYADSIIDVKKYLEINPDNIKAIIFLGELYYLRKDFETAIEQFERVLRVYPHDTRMQLNIKRCQREIEGYSVYLEKDKDPKNKYRHTRQGSDMTVEGKHYKPSSEPMIGGSIVRFFKAVDASKELLVKKPMNYRCDKPLFLNESIIWGLLYPPEEYPAKWFEVEDQDFLRLVLPKLPGVTLERFIKEPITILEYLQLFLALVKELDKLHERCMCIHGDLNSKNILVNRTSNGNFIVYLIDFGLSNQITTYQETFDFDCKGTSPHLPPEVFSPAKNTPALFEQSPKIDVYSFCYLILSNTDLSNELSSQLKEILLLGKSNIPTDRPSLLEIIDGIKENITNLTVAPPALSM